jgi:hypothetical protein
MAILAIDPGDKKSAYVLYEAGDVLECGILENEQLLKRLETSRVEWKLTFEHMAIEMVACYGMPVGKTVFDTCVWIGRFIQTCPLPEITTTKIYRKDVKIHLCNSMRAKDGNIRQALIDKYPATGGGKIPQIGTKKQPGPLYGVSKDIWSALAVAVTYSEMLQGHQL